VSTKVEDKGILLMGKKPCVLSTKEVKSVIRNKKLVKEIPIKIDLGLADMDKMDDSYLKIPDEYGDYYDAKELCKYRVGDIIYVKETFRYVSLGEVSYEGECIWQKDIIQFKASEGEFYEKYRDYIGEYEKWKTSIHLTKDLSRITLEVISVEVKRIGTGEFVWLVGFKLVEVKSI